MSSGVSLSVRDALQRAVLGILNFVRRSDDAVLFRRRGDKGDSTMICFSLLPIIG